MDLKQITNEHLIVLDCELEHKLDVIRLLVDRLYEEGKISDKEQFWKDVMAREALSETGISDGVAIPHGKSDAVKEASFAFARLKKPVQDWESMEEGNQVTLVFLPAIPTAEAGSTHLDVLAALMTHTQDEEFLNTLRSAKTPADVYNNLNMQKKAPKSAPNKTYTHTIVAVTACPAGIAHTYMAADALEKAGEEMGVKVYVEKQGANGVEGRQTPEHLKQADAAIFAVDVAVKESERFSHLPVYKTRVAAPIKDAQGVIRAALELAKTSAKGEYKGETAPAAASAGGFWNDVKSSVLTGISYIIPIIVAGGMINAFAVLIAQGFGLQDFAATEGTWMYYFKQMGSGMLGTIMIPVLAAYMAYSLGDKTALAPGFAAGIAPTSSAAVSCAACWTAWWPGTRCAGCARSFPPRVPWPGSSPSGSIPF